MPCCGLEQPRERIPARYAIAGGGVFWGAFLIGALVGVATCWRARGRWLLAVEWGFLRALWAEALRRPTSVPVRVNCRLSGRLLRVAPAFAAWLYRHPEVLLVVVPGLVLIGLAGGVLAALAPLAGGP